MKKHLVKLASFATLLAFGALSVSASPVTVPGAEDEEKENFIVTLTANPGDYGDKVRNRVLSRLASALPEDSYEILAEYDTVMNGFAINTYPEVADYIEANISGISEVSQEHVYAAPQADEGTGSVSLVGDYAAEKLGNYSAETISATEQDVNAAIQARGGDTQAQLGKGITIGIIDTGLILNQVDGTTERNNTLSEGGGAANFNPAAFVDLPSSSDYNVLTEESISSAGLSHGYTRYNNKIAYTYDYAGNDTDVDPDHVEGNHGTHVASLAAANGDAFKGIAPNAQLAIMKVFPDDASGAGDTAIIGALNDAAKMHLDIVNLSLGTDLIDSESSESLVYEAIEGAVDAGVIVNYAAGNSGKSSFSSSQGYSDYTTDTVETSILGSSSLFDEKANVVASTNPDRAFFESIMTVDYGDESVAVSYDDQNVNKENSTIEVDDPQPLASLLDTNPDGEFSFARIGGLGRQADYDNFFEQHPELNGTLAGSNGEAGYIAVVTRGETSFWDKVQTAYANGAIAMIVVNNNPSVVFNFNFDWNDNSPQIPAVLVFQNLGYVFGEEGNIGTLHIASNSVENAPDGNITSSFSSDGPSYDLDIDPTIAAPGSAVIGAVAAEVTGETSGLKGYDNLSGTSMATPNFSGALASILSEKKPENNGSLASEDDEAFASYKKLVSSIVMATANPVNDNTGNNLASPRIQGAGNVNVHDALLNESYVTTTVTDDNADAWTPVGTEVAKAELKNAGSLNTDLSKDEEAYIEFSYTIHNDSDTNKTYKPSLSLLIPSLRVQMTQREYDENLATDPSQVADIPENLPDTITMSINDDSVDLGDQQLSGTVTVNAGSTYYQRSVRVRIDNLHFHKDFVDEQDRDAVPSFDGTLREYFNQYFNYEGGAGGSYIEGYLTFEETSDDSADKEMNLSLPYMGFYGDYTKGLAVEPFEFEKVDGHLYNSEMIDTYIKNVTDRTVQRPNAYTGSTLSATSSFSTSDMLSISEMRSSARAGQGKYVSVEGPSIDTDGDGEGETTLYAGAEGVSDVLVASFFVNRSISDSSWVIEGTNLSGKLSDATGEGVYSEGGLYRSILLAGSTGYAIHRAYAGISLKTIPEGTYTLTFSFTLRATNTVQTKSYNLVVDKTAPELVSTQYSTTSSGRIRLEVITRGGDAYTSFGALTGATNRVIPTKVEGSDDLYSTVINVSDAMIESNGISITFHDYANNAANYVLKPDNLGSTIVGEGLSQGDTFNFDLLNQDDSGYMYDFTLLRADGSVYDDYEGEITVNLYLGKDLDIGTPLSSTAAAGSSSLGLQEITCYVDGNPVSAIYDPSTGYAKLTFEIQGGMASITIPVEPSNPSELPTIDPDNPGGGDEDSSNTGNSSSSGNTSSSGTSSSENNSSSTTPGGEVEPTEPSEGLQAWQIALIVVGAIVVVGVIGGLVYFFCFKKKPAKK